MIRRQISLIAFGAAICAVGTGCMDLKHMMKEHMDKAAIRPAELDNYNMFVGNWELTGELKIHGSDEVIPCKGTDSLMWNSDKRLLIQTATFEMGDMGKGSMAGVWGYDCDKKRYVVGGMDACGGLSKGTAKYCPDSKTWTMTDKSSHGTGKGHMTFKDANTIEWYWWHPGPFGQKIVEFTGTSLRK